MVSHTLCANQRVSEGLVIFNSGSYRSSTFWMVGFNSIRGVVEEFPESCQGHVHAH